MTDWTGHQCVIIVQRPDGELIQHLAYGAAFGGEIVCAGLDAHASQVQFMIDAANERMKLPGFFRADGEPT